MDMTEVMMEDAKNVIDKATRLLNRLEDGSEQDFSELSMFMQDTKDAANELRVL